jgi:protection-of-telomeres protein 1
VYKGEVSLLVHKFSQFNVLPSSYLSRGPPSVTNAPWTPSKEERPTWQKPTADETSYILKASREVFRTALPSVDKFKEMASQSINVKDKFSLLKDIKPDGFYDIIGEVIRVFDGSSGSVTVYLSDYTAHPLFYHYAWKNNEETSSPGRKGDEYGYTTSKSRKSDEWPGPYGKLTIQLTCFDGNATFAREQVKQGYWLLMKNVNIKPARDGNFLEGKLRGDRNAFEAKHQIEIVHPSNDSENTPDPRWKDALARKRKYLEKFKKQKHAKLDEDAAVESRDKRERDDESAKMTSKRRRKEKRAAAQYKETVIEAQTAERLDLNTNSTCYSS